MRTAVLNFTFKEKVTKRVAFRNAIVNAGHGADVTLQDAGDST